MPSSSSYSSELLCHSTIVGSISAKKSYTITTTTTTSAAVKVFSLWKSLWSLVMTTAITLIFTCFLLSNSFLNAPSTGVTCHGPLYGVQYRYQYETDLTLNNNDNLEPAGFGVVGRFSVENLWQNRDHYLTEVRIEHIQFKPRSNAKSYQFSTGPLLSTWPPVLAQIDGTTGQLVKLFVRDQQSSKSADRHTSHHLLEPTHQNLVVSFLNSLKNRFPKDEQNLSYRWYRDGQTLVRHSEHRETSSVYSLLAPQIIDKWEIRSQLANDHDVAETVSGWQNVSIESKIYPSAHSKLFVSFMLKLINEQKTDSESQYQSADTLLKAVSLYGTKHNHVMIPLTVHLISEKKPCHPHLCQGLAQFVADHSKQLAEDHSLATTSISVAYLRLLNYIRANSAHITRKEIHKLLEKYDRSKHTDGNVYITLLDSIAGSRHGEALMASLDMLDLLKCHDEKANECERFLVAVAVSAITAANMGNSYVAEHSLSSEQLMDLFVPLTKSTKWADDRVKHSFALTMGTLLHSYHLQHKLVNQQTTGSDGVKDSRSSLYQSNHSSLYADTLIAPHYSSPDQFVVLDEDSDSHQTVNKHHQTKPNRFHTVAEKVIKHLIHELDNCKESDCRIVYLHALGNSRIVSKHGVLGVLKRYATTGAKRESVAAMKALRDCVEFEFSSGGTSGNTNNDKLLTRLKHLLIRVVYDSNLETTSRLIAAELLAKHIDQHGDITYELVQHLETFPSELATIIWKRAVENVRSRSGNVGTGSGTTGVNRYSDWHLHSKVLSGSSASFRYVMGGTGYANASYGVLLELLKGKLPKETSFNVDISNQDLTQDVINVGLFARGLQSFAGESEEDSANEVQTDEEDSTLAGMTLQVLGNQLRPFLFFRSTSELMGHVWAGAASEPTPVFRANLLLSDYMDVKPLINGFLVEQSLKGIFSLDLNGEVQISLWNRNSHSVVQTMGAILFQGSQEIFTTDRKTSSRKFFSFGAESNLNFITDFDFYSSPYRICIQITQPEFVFRHNTRKYEQVHSDDLHRRIHRRSYKIPAKSYILNRDNSEMCALMNADAD